MKQPEDVYTIDMFEDERIKSHVQYIKELRTKVVDYTENAFDTLPDDYETGDY